METLGGTGVHNHSDLRITGVIRSEGSKVDEETRTDNVAQV